jgi:hypothetical protein
MENDSTGRMKFNFSVLCLARRSYYRIVKRKKVRIEMLSVDGKYLNYCSKVFSHKVNNFVIATDFHENYRKPKNTLEKLIKKI